MEGNMEILLWVGGGSIIKKKEKNCEWQSTMKRIRTMKSKIDMATYYL